jgi:hypothetical protein
MWLRVIIVCGVGLAGCTHAPSAERPDTKVVTKRVVRVVCPACPRKTRCDEMESCAEAIYHFRVCHQYQLDRNKNEVPCEQQCGKSKESIAAELKKRPYSAPAPSEQFCRHR